MERIPDMTLTADWDIMHQLCINSKKKKKKKKKKKIFWHAQWAYKNLNPLKVFKYSYVYITSQTRKAHAMRESKPVRVSNMLGARY